MKKLFYILLIPLSIFAQVTYQKSKFDQVWYDAAKEKSHSTFALFDTSSIKAYYTSTGKPLFEIYDQVGSRVFHLDSLGVVHADSLAVGTFLYSGANFADSLRGTGFTKDIDEWFDSNGILSVGIKNGVILNEDINSSAAIAGTKISPDFGSQDVITKGMFRQNITDSTDDDEWLKPLGYFSRDTLTANAASNSDGYGITNTEIRTTFIDNGGDGSNEWPVGMAVISDVPTGSVFESVWSQYSGLYLSGSVVNNAYSHEAYVAPFGGTAAKIVAYNGKIDLSEVGGESGNITNAIGVSSTFTGNPAAGSALTNGYGFKFTKPSAYTRYTNMYGLYLDSVAGASGSAYSIYSAGGDAYFEDDVTADTIKAYIQDGKISNAAINASANIAGSKLADYSITSAKVDSDAVLPYHIGDGRFSFGDEDRDDGLYIISNFVNSYFLQIGLSGDGKLWNWPSTSVMYDARPDIFRDPSMIEHDGYYYIASTRSWTPVSALRIVRSPDLIHWADWDTVTVSDSATIVWAPEWFKDTDGSIYLFFTADLDSSAALYSTVNHQPFYIKSLSNDFKTWSDPVQITGDLPTNVIDLFIQKHDGYYWMFYKNNDTFYINVARSTTATGTYNQYRTTNWTGWAYGAEGVSIVKVDSTKWRAYYDVNSPSVMYWSECSDDSFYTWTTPVLCSSYYGGENPTVIKTTSLSAFRDAFRLSLVKADTTQQFRIMGTADKPLIVNSSVASSQTSAQFTGSGLTAGQDADILLGKGTTGYNAGVFRYHYTYADSNKNYVGVGLKEYPTVLTVFGNKRVGINDTNPQTTLSVYDASGATFGVKTATAGLHVNVTTQNADIQIGRGSSSYYANFLFANSPSFLSSVQWAVGMRAGGNGFYFYDDANDVTRMYLTQDGKLGIGTTTPDKTLGLSDGTDEYSISVASDKLTFWNDAATPAAKMTIDSTGNVDISGVLTYNYIHAFAEKEDTTITPNCNGNGVYTKIGGLFNSTGIIENDGLTLSLGDSITIITPGDYRITYSFTVLGGNAIDWKIAVFKNSVKQYGVRRTTSGVTNYSGGTLPYYLKNLVTGDDISFKVTNLTNPYTDDPTFTNLNIFIEKMPE